MVAKRQDPKAKVQKQLNKQKAKDRLTQNVQRDESPEAKHTGNKRDEELTRTESL